MCLGGKGKKERKKKANKFFLKKKSTDFNLLPVGGRGKEKKEMF